MKVFGTKKLSTFLHDVIYCKAEFDFYTRHYQKLKCVINYISAVQSHKNFEYGHISRSFVIVERHVVSRRTTSSESDRT